MIIHNDIMGMLDAKLNIVLLLFDLSDAFDTDNHNILLGKRWRQYGLTDIVFVLFEFYCTCHLGSDALKSIILLFTMSVFYQVFLKVCFGRTAI